MKWSRHLRLTDEQLAAHIHDKFLVPSLAGVEDLEALRARCELYAWSQEPAKALARDLARWHADRVAQAVAIAVKETKDGR